MDSLLHLIWNPVAGNGAAISAYQLVADALAERGIAFTSVKSEYSGHATELAKQAVQDGVGKVVVLGGDGTIREVASAMMNTDVPLGIISCGTGNDIIRACRAGDRAHRRGAPDGRRDGKRPALFQRRWVRV